jgi:hypothetical protein
MRMRVVLVVLVVVLVSLGTRKLPNATYALVASTQSARSDCTKLLRLLSLTIHRLTTRTKEASLVLNSLSLGMENWPSKQDYIELLMHLLFLGVASDNFELDLLYLKSVDQGASGNFQKMHARPTESDSEVQSQLDTCVPFLNK